VGVGFLWGDDSVREVHIFCGVVVWLWEPTILQRKMCGLGAPTFHLLRSFELNRRSISHYVDKMHYFRIAFY
jgi:hypothetical protein